MDIIYLAFSKTSDKVPHQRLLKQTKAHGVGENIQRWTSEWLRERKQRVVIRVHKSKWRMVQSIVPQGSVLWPLLFTIFRNDIDDTS